MMENLGLVTLDWDSASEKVSFAEFPLKGLERVLNTILPDERLGKIDDWEYMDDTEILKKLELDRFASNVIYAITDISYVKNVGVFEIQLQDFKKFTTMYFNEYRECFFSGCDVILILPHDNAIFFVHHSVELFFYRLPLSR